MHTAKFILSSLTLSAISFLTACSNQDATISAMENALAHERNKVSELTQKVQDTAQELKKHVDSNELRVKYNPVANLDIQYTLKDDSGVIAQSFHDKKGLLSSSDYNRSGSSDREGVSINFRYNLTDVSDDSQQFIGRFDLSVRKSFDSPLFDSFGRGQFGHSNSDGVSFSRMYKSDVNVTQVFEFGDSEDFRNLQLEVMIVPVPKSA